MGPADMHPVRGPEPPKLPEQAFLPVDESIVKDLQTR